MEFAVRVPVRAACPDRGRDRPFPRPAGLFPSCAFQADCAPFHLRQLFHGFRELAGAPDASGAFAGTFLSSRGSFRSSGGGAEILDDEARKSVSPNKINSAAWLNVMEEAHKQGLKTTATMMFRKTDSAEIIVSHFDKIRSLQDKTGGFTAFIPWPFQPGNSELDDEAVTAIEYLRVLALARIYLDNIPNLQVSWVTQGAKVAQIGLFYGGNDFGSVMIEENVVKAAGANFRLKTEEIKHIIKSAGFIPKIRNMQYDIIGE